MSISNGYTGRNVLIFSLMVGCFALLWPRVFIPMFQSSYSSSQDVSHEVTGTHRPSVLPCCHPVVFSKELNALFFTELCNQLKRRVDRRGLGANSLLPPEPLVDIWTPGLPAWCRDELARACGVIIDESSLEKYRRASHKRNDGDAATRNLTVCLEVTYEVRREQVRPPRTYSGWYAAAGNSPADHRAMHPSLRAGHLRDSAQSGQPPPPHSMGRQPKRVLDRMARPGPQPGSRPTPGGYGAVPQSTKGTGAMGIIMPIYTIGIVVFFVYTIMKVMFKSPEGDKEPVINDFHMTTELRSYAPRLGASANGGAPPPPRYRPEVVRRVEDPPPPSAAAAEDEDRSHEIGTGDRKYDRKDAEIDQLRRRLEETERAMERIMKQMSTVSEKLNVAKISTNIKAIKKLLSDEELEGEDLWGSMDSVASDSLGSERSLSMESLAQTEASLASLEDDVMKAEKATKKSNVKDKKGSRGPSTNKKVTASPDLGAVRRVQSVKKT